jgi:hypothetical protein
MRHFSRFRLQTCTLIHVVAPDVVVGRLDNVLPWIALRFGLMGNTERETGLEPATSSLGIHAFVGSKSLARSCCDLLNLQRLAESALSSFVGVNETRMRQGRPANPCVAVRISQGNRGS